MKKIVSCVRFFVVVWVFVASTSCARFEKIAPDRISSHEEAVYAFGAALRFNDPKYALEIVSDVRDESSNKLQIVKKSRGNTPYEGKFNLSQSNGRFPETIEKHWNQFYLKLTQNLKKYELALESELTAEHIQKNLFEESRIIWSDGAEEMVLLAGRFSCGKVVNEQLEELANSANLFCQDKSVTPIVRVSVICLPDDRNLSRKRCQVTDFQVL